MAIAQTKKPYEFLARWDDAGNLRGAHVVFRESITDEGTEISSKIGDTLAVGIGGQQGFPIADILSTLQADALADVTVKTAELAALTTEKATLTTEKAAAIAAHEAAEAQVASLTTAMDALTQDKATTVEANTAAVAALTKEKADAAEANTAAVAALNAEKAATAADRDAAVAQAADMAKQVAELNDKLAALQPPVNSFSRKAVKVALSNAGLLDQFDAVVADPQDSDQKMAMIAWQEDDTFTNTSPVLVLTFARMKLTDEQVAAVFAAAAAL